jgi:hypothetical protein
MKSTSTLFSVFALLALGCLPARAQIGGICEANSYNCSTLTNYTWVSIYGTNLPTGSGAYVFEQAPGLVDGQFYEYEFEVAPSYDQSTQVNFYLDGYEGYTINNGQYTEIDYNVPWDFSVCYSNGSCTTSWSIVVYLSGSRP